MSRLNVSKPPKNHSLNYTLEGTCFAASALHCGLYLVSTPIGNLSDITLRALKTLAGVDFIYAEDTRTSRHLLTYYGISKPLGAYHEHNGEVARPQIIDKLQKGMSVALISDAGTPLISDPGFKLVRDVIASGFQVISNPGASALLGALVCAGVPTDRFIFEGFLPSSTKDRLARYESWKAQAISAIVYESPRKIIDLVGEIASFQGQWQVVIARELTKLYEEFIRGTAAQIYEQLKDKDALRGECVLIVSPVGSTQTDTEIAIEVALKQALDVLGHKEAVQIIAEQFKMPKKTIYSMALAMKKDI